MFPVSAPSAGVDVLAPEAQTVAPEQPRPRLTRKERDLLATLQQNPGQCLPREYLLRTIWGYEEGSRTRTLDVHIQRLRRKLGPTESARILTIFRTGYCWSTNGDGGLN